MVPSWLWILMSRKEDLYIKVKSSAANLTFKDLCKLAELTGFEYRRTSGSHKIYKHPKSGTTMNFQPVKNKAKPYQVKQLLDVISEYNLMGEKNV